MKRTFTAALAAVAIALAATPGMAATPPAPPATPGPPGYYIMQGKIIVSDPFTDVNACMKALQKIQKTVAPGNDTLVCAHRRP